MSGLLISIVLVLGASFAVSSAAPVQTYAESEPLRQHYRSDSSFLQTTLVMSEGPLCDTPVDGTKSLDCAVMLQMAGKTITSSLLLH